MSVTRTFTVTVVSTGSGNKYFIDGVQQETVTLAEGYTYRFDISDSSVSSHPFRFSTTSDGTHEGGSEYTTGVTVTASYVEIVVADPAPQLYYYCSSHPAMGGAANTEPADTWSMLTWGQNSWGAQDTVTIPATGLSSTSSVGDGTNMGVPAQGWGGTTWSNGEWGEVTDNGVELTGLSLTSALNATGVQSYSLNGWGRNTWSSESWGDSDNPVITLDGQSMTSTVGTVDSLTKQVGVVNFGEIITGVNFLT